MHCISLCFFCFFFKFYCTCTTFVVNTRKHKFIKISSPLIFHAVHCHSVADSLCLKSLVWVVYQLQCFHGNKSTLAREFKFSDVSRQLYVNEQNDFDERGH